MLAAAEHALDAEADGRHREGGTPLIVEDAQANVPIRVDVLVEGWWG